MRSECTFIALALLACAVGAASAADLSVDVADLKNQPLHSAIVFALPRSGQALPAGQPERVVIDQVHRQFVPLVSVVRTGTKISFPNSDDFRHSIYSFSSPKVFNTKLYSGRQAAPVLFDQPGLVVLGCNIHDSMAAWIVVTDTPFFGTTDLKGVVKLQGLPPGDYELNAWYPSAQFTPTRVSISIGTDPLEQRVTLDSTGSPLPALEARAAQSSRERGP